jgi:hypothetical protein
MPQQKSARLTLVLCVLAAVFYNSWPLGYKLDNQTARYSLASDLERTGHPYYWLFILGDVLTAMSLSAAGALVWFKLRPGLPTKAWAAICGGLLLFGVGTAVAAVAPAQCAGTTALGCGVHDGQGLGLDGIFSVLAACGLFISLLGACVLGARHKVSLALVRTTQALLVAWAASGIWFVILALSTNSSSAHFPQQVFLVLSGLAFIAIGLNVGD